MRHAIADPLSIDLSPSQGLSTPEAQARRAIHGPNDVLQDATPAWREVLRDSARDPMIWFLVGTAALFAMLGDHTEAAVLAFALLPILGMDAWLHRRTRASTESLAGRLSTSARVLRDGRLVQIPSVELVPGDLVHVAASEYLPADGLILSGEGLQIDESALSGESLPQRKAAYRGAPEPLRAGVDALHWGAAGTRVMTGALGLRVVATGARTMYGGISRMAQTGSQARTPLQQSIAGLVRILVVVAGLLCAVLALTRYLQGHGVVDALLSAVTLAVAALPEEFPVVFTVFLGVGVFRLARRKALVRRAVVVENMGRVTAICTDKSGTLTEGRLHLQHLVPAPGLDEAGLLSIAARASRAETQDPLDLAVIARAGALSGTRLATFPFNEKCRREIAVFAHDNDAGVAYAVAKGAPETLLALSGCDDEAQRHWLEQAAQLAAGGHKVIACAQRSLPAWNGAEPDGAFAFAGLLAFEDPVRPGVAEAVTQLQRAGLRVLMVTGDHPLTARAIARDAGIGGESPTVVAGTELAARIAQRGATALDGVDVVARCLPLQKLEIVNNLQARGEIVAVTGDGVNDVPALQGADIGIAMGERGTQPAREAASIVLMDDDFRTIAGAIAEGRQLFESLKLSFAYLLIVHIPLVLTAALVPLAGYPLLYLPIHIVWLELLIHPTAILAFQSLPTGYQGAGRDRGFFSGREWAVIGACGTVLTALVGAGYAYSLGPDADVGHARAMAMLMLIVASAATTLSLTQGRTTPGWIAAGATLLSALLIIPFAPLAALFSLQALHVDDWLLAALAGLAAGGITSGFGGRRTGADRA